MSDDYHWYETPDDAVYPERKFIADPVLEAISEAVGEAMTSALHPEFGTEWREPDGMIWKAIQQAKAEERERIAQAIEAEVPVGFPERYIEKAVAVRIARGEKP